MTPRDYAEKVMKEFGYALDAGEAGVVEELQVACMVLCGIVLALTTPNQRDTRKEDNP